ncbi:8200_t:CDS:2 [Acaulospora morrowiae]|uniref:8200_t:CDS:1 n=1 Tax=Acaulospora morrowiae TaxID=94023 RepID=A0A9N8WK20_9GLOM|nr:8200_t:CDS:2 [Acaulospora morrowiae]
MLRIYGYRLGINLRHVRKDKILSISLNYGQNSYIQRNYEKYMDFR